MFRDFTRHLASPPFRLSVSGSAFRSNLCNSVFGYNLALSTCDSSCVGLRVPIDFGLEEGSTGHCSSCRGLCDEPLHQVRAVGQ